MPGQLVGLLGRKYSLISLEGEMITEAERAEKLDNMLIAAERDVNESKAAGGNLAYAYAKGYLKALEAVRDELEIDIDDF